MEGKMTLVIVDDEIGITRSLEREIRLEFGSSPFEIITFNNPLDALPWIEEHREDVFLVISDLRMPQMNGSEFLTRVRLFSNDIRAVLLTAFTDFEHIRKAVSTSLVSLMFKPWEREELISEVQQALTNRNLERENNLLTNRITEMLRSTGNFQKELFSVRLRNSKHLAMTSVFSPLERYHCGGDFYDINEEKDSVLIVLGDVSGHGPRSAVVACMVKVLLSETLNRQPQLAAAPDLLLQTLNERFCDLFIGTPEILIGLTALYLDFPRQSMSLAIAALPPVIHVRQGVPEILKTPNPLPGAFRDSRYCKTERVLLPNDHIILFTDGLAEAAPAYFAHEEAALIALFTRRQSYAAPDIKNAFIDLIPEGEFSDDVTILSLQVQG